MKRMKISPPASGCAVCQAQWDRSISRSGFEFWRRAIARSAALNLLPEQPTAKLFAALNDPLVLHRLAAAKRWEAAATASC